MLFDNLFTASLVNWYLACIFTSKIGTTIYAFEKKLTWTQVLPDGLDELLVENIHIHSCILSLKVTHSKEAEFRMEILPNTTWLELVYTLY